VLLVVAEQFYATLVELQNTGDQGQDH
jgi:hypothetical protein